jgi:Gram-negative porin
MQIQLARSGVCRPRRNTNAIILVAMLSYPAGAAAGTEEPGTAMFSLSGFGTLGVVHSSEDQADFTSNIFKPNGAGHSHDWSAGVDSLISAQVTADITSQLSAVVQAISEQNYDNSYAPHLEWANIKYQLIPDLDVRVGRTVLPAFLLSDTRKVGYAYPWVRTPLEVYQLSPITHNDGLDVSYRLKIGELTNTAQAIVGRSDSKLPDDGGTLKSRDSWGITDTVEFGSLTVRLNYQKTHLILEAVNPFFDAFRQFGPQGNAVADRYSMNGKPFALFGVGASYDSSNWFLMSEWGSEDTHSFAGKASSWYASGGYRFAKITPYITYAESRVHNLSDPGIDVSVLPPFLAGPASDLNAALNSLLSTQPAGSTVSVGGRWDLMRNTDLKLQFDHKRNDAGSTGNLINLQPGFQLGGSFYVFSITVDFVF